MIDVSKIKKIQKEDDRCLKNNFKNNMVDVSKKNSKRK